MSLKSLRSKLQKYRYSVIALMVFIVSIYVELITNENLFAMFIPINIKYSSDFIFNTIGFMIVIGLFLNKYLSSDEENRITTNFYNDVNDPNIEILKSNLEEIVASEIGQVRNTISTLEKNIKKNKADELSNEERRELIDTIKNNALEKSSEEIFQELKAQTSKLLSGETSKRLESHFRRTINRLTTEIKELGKRSRVNLIIGSLAAFAGVSIFMLFVFEKVGDSNAQTYLVKEFAPRISLVIVIEIFAYFFLGLHKNNLSEIKHFHNELTNIEQKYMAIEEALASATPDTVKEIVIDFSKTERNFLLKKGESTISLEERRFTGEEQNSIINALIRKVPKPTK